MKKTNLIKAALFTLTLTFAVSGMASAGNSFVPEVNRGHLPKLMYRAINLTDSKMSEVKPEFYDWEWTGAVMMVGLNHMYELTGEQRYLDYIRQWVDYHIEHGYTLSQSDQVVPGYPLLKVYKATNDPRYLEHAKRIGKYVTEEALRTDEGGLIHFGPIGSKSMWIDSLFMLGPFLIELSEITGDGKYLDEAVRQTLIMYSHLQDSRSGLCKHYWNETTGKMNNAHWLRGNSWALVATSILLDALPQDYDPQKRAQLVEYFQKHANGFSKVQDENGLWHTVIDDKKTYFESSGTALVAFALIKGVEAGVIDVEYMRTARRALRGLMEYVQIHPDGFCTISDVSMGTNPGNAAYYNQVVRAENVPYGVGAFAMAVNAYSAYEKYAYNRTAMRVEDGWEALRWGRIDEAEKAMSEAVENAPNNSNATFGLGITLLGKTLVGLFEAFTEMSVGAKGMTPAKFRVKLVEDFSPAFSQIAELFGRTEKDPEFTEVTERMVFLGGTAFGYIQWDVAEVHMMHAIAKFAEGAFYFFGSYNIDGPSVPLARREFGKIVRDPNYPKFLTLNDQSMELLPKSRAAFAVAFSNIKAMVGRLNERKTDHPGCLVTLDILRLKGSFSIPGLVAAQPPTALVSKNFLVQAILKHIAKNVPEKLPRWMDNANRSLLENETVKISKSVSVNLSAPFENPIDLRDLFPEHKPDGSKIFPDPTMGGLLPGMTHKTLGKVMK